MRAFSAVLLGLAFFPAPGRRVDKLSAIQCRAPGSAVPGSLLLSPDSAQLFYRANELAHGVAEFLTAPSDGSTDPVASPYGTVFAFSPDGDWLVHARHDGLFAQPWPAGAPLRLAADRAEAVQFSADSSRVVYAVSVAGGPHSFAVPVDGSSAPVALGDAPVSGEFRSLCKLSPDGAWAVFHVSGGPAPERLVSVPLTGGPGIQLATLPAGQDAIDTFALTPDSTRVVYTAEQVSNLPPGFQRWRREIHAVPIDGSAPSTRLNPGVPANSEVWFPPLVSGDHVVYVSDQDPLAGMALYQVPADGSAAPKLLHATPGGSVDRLSLDAVGGKVVYVRRGSSSEPTKLWVVPADGSAAPLELSSPSDPGSFVFQVEPLITPDGTRAVFLSFPYPCSVPLDGSAPATLLTPAFGPATRTSGPLRLTPDGARLVFVADQDTPGQHELYSVPVDGSQLPVRLSAPLAAPGDVAEFALARDGTRVAYLADQEPDHEAQVLEAYVASIDGSMPAVQVSRIAPGPLAGRIAEFRVLGRRALYRGDQDQDEQQELYSVPIDGLGAPVRLNGVLPPGGDVQQWDIGAAAQRAVYVADHPSDNRFELYSRALDGSGAPVRLSGNATASTDVVDFALVPPGLALVFRRDTGSQDELFVAPLDGSAAPAKLYPPLLAGRRVHGYVVGATRIAYLADHDVPQEVELFARPLDRSAPAVQLNRPLVAGGDVLACALTPDESRVVFRADQRIDGVVELFSVPSDGSAPPVRLHPALPAGLSVADFLLDPGGAQVVFRADLTGSGALELFRAPLDGSGAVARLHPAFPAFADVASYRIDASGTHVLFQADALVDGRQDLFSAPLAGGPARWLNATSAAQGNVRFFQPDGSGARVAFAVDVPGSLPDLFLSPADGSGPALRLSAPGDGVAGPDVLFLDGGVVYRTLEALAWVPIDGGTPRTLTPPSAGGPLLWALSSAPLAASEERVLFLAGFEHWGLVELFALRLHPPTRRR